MRAAWRPGYHAGHRLDAEKALEVVESIRLRDGIVQPTVLVVEASTPDSPIHEGFTWRDSVAAQKWRDSEARLLLRSLVLVEQDENPSEAPPAYVSVTRLEDGGSVSGYDRFAHVMSEPDEHQQVIEQAVAMLRGLERRYRHLGAKVLRPLSRARNVLEESGK